MKLKAYARFSVAGMIDFINYRANFFFFFIGNILLAFVLYFLWKAVYGSSASSFIHGFSLLDMTAYLFMANITGVFIYSEASYVVGEEIVEGSIAMRFIKPVSYDLSILSMEIGRMFISFFTVVLPITIGVEVYRYYVTGQILFSLTQFGFFLISCLLGYLVIFYFNLCFGYMAFVFKNLWGFNRLKDSIIGFLSGSMVPIIFFPAWAQKVLQFLPFSSMNYTPVMLYLGKIQGEAVVLALAQQLFWAVFFWGLSKCIWAVTVRHITIQGG